MILRLLSLSLCAAGFVVGSLFLFAPAQLIELQRKFYEKINWKIEPINFAREIRNTRVMGIIIAVFSLATLIFYIARNPLFLN